MQKEIVKIEKIGKRYFIFLSKCQVPLIVSENILVKYRLMKNKKITDEELIMIEKEQSIDDVMEKVLSYLSYKARTKNEIFNYLRKFNLSLDEEDLIMQKLLSNDLINDEKYGEAYVAQSIQQYKGILLIRKKLMEVGIDEKIIDHCLSQYQEEMQKDNAFVVAKKHQQFCLKNPIKKQQEKIYQKLYSLGYPQDIIFATIKKLDFVTDYEQLKKEYLALKHKNIENEQIIKKLLLKGYEYQEIQKFGNKDIFYFF